MNNALSADIEEVDWPADNELKFAKKTKNLKPIEAMYDNKLKRYIYNENKVVIANKLIKKDRKHCTTFLLSFTEENPHLNKYRSVNCSYDLNQK